jgi:RNA polymerase sigma factor (TIGR02999 family)
VPVPAEDALFASLYQELRALARREIRRRGRTESLDTTALIHEAYLKLAAASRTQVANRGHFLALACRVMRQVLVDHVRRNGALKRGTGLCQTLGDNEQIPTVSSGEDLLTLDQALDKLESLEPRLARMVELRFFGGLSVEEAAESLEISVATVKRDWLRARAFLYSQMTGSQG